MGRSHSGGMVEMEGQEAWVWRLSASAVPRPFPALQEDIKLIQLVETYGPQNWSLIAKVPRPHACMAPAAAGWLTRGPLPPAARPAHPPPTLITADFGQRPQREELPPPVVQPTGSREQSQAAGLEFYRWLGGIYGRCRQRRASVGPSQRRVGR